MVQNSVLPFNRWMADVAFLFLFCFVFSVLLNSTFVISKQWGGDNEEPDPKP